MVLPTPSVSFNNLKCYMESLNKLKNLDLDYIFYSHTPPETECFADAKPKIADYISYRQASEQKMLDLIKVSSKLKDIWQGMYGARQFANEYELSLIQKNFDMQLAKL